ncbi:ArsR/SmtB family transcription factor [Curtobacterium flaccumfaciens]|uniref:ArsR/SmtB family transcription factor n=1 Tax=Curtobacterium flaccumfaciens TaxID=2035 RepID=UPI00217D2668|nr:metalloregulator ArsR/SmtB family transcription factor [Curtobacterium flaccumfaciens]MCS6556032.1 metalloregulator ArsR/SmtB family transcription factor [Curtobacterium flaccumfaciens]
MSGEPDISVPARALGDPVRARMVAALLGDRAMPSGDLAREAGVSASTASEHLRTLLDARLVHVEQRGRNRLYRLASSEVSRAVEALQGMAPLAEIQSLRAHRISRELRAGRTCYDHLAGDLGLRMTDLLVGAGVVGAPRIGEPAEPLEPFPQGPVVAALGIVPPSGRRPWVRGCLDWTGRRAHVAGQLGTQVLRTMDAQGWILRPSTGRAVRLTASGERALALLESATA